jgi:hypothetical protein
MIQFYIPWEGEGGYNENLKNRQSEDVYHQKSYFHFRFNTNSGVFFPMQSIFYLKPQGRQIWA